MRRAAAVSWTLSSTAGDAVYHQLLSLLYWSNHCLPGELTNMLCLTLLMLYTLQCICACMLLLLCVLLSCELMLHTHATFSDRFCPYNTSYRCPVSLTFQHNKRHSIPLPMLLKIVFVWTLLRCWQSSERTASSSSRQIRFVQMFATCKNCRKFILTPFWVIQIAKFVIFKDLHRDVSFSA
jgi:hypothetical protein